MRTQEYWTDNNNVQLHTLQSERNSDSGIPLVYIPGALGTAEDFIPGMESLPGHPLVSVSLRGRGKSDAPESGYAFEDHVSDLEAIVEDIPADKICLFGFSMSVPIAVEYAARHSEQTAGLILGDYPALYPPVSPEWAEHVIANGTKPHVAHGIQKESKEIVLWNRLKELTAPILYLYGCAEGAHVGGQGGAFIKEIIPHATFVPFEESGHELWEPDHDRFIGVLRDFLDQITTETAD